MDAHEAVHPKTTQPYAESPYNRKLKRIKEDLQMALSLADVEDVTRLAAIIDLLDEIITVS